MSIFLCDLKCPLNHTYTHKNIHFKKLLSHVINHMCRLRFLSSGGIWAVAIQSEDLTEIDYPPFDICLIHSSENHAYFKQVCLPPRIYLGHWTRATWFVELCQVLSWRCIWKIIQYNVTFEWRSVCVSKLFTVEFQWLQHLWNHENMFETGIVWANEC